ncbi:unnamed protein product [Ambrosiozyma monospora]|uniref:Unnamed protein product n=1 Tax=Ambrosiozyma monospora TaxID=43982 RepID=A0ACB5T8T1_AMBMO|nr:unnamed protein product [Ambrosiozyma monospora]
MNLFLILLANKYTVYWFGHHVLKLCVEFCLVFLFPLLIMGISYFAQPSRYYILRLSGCKVGFTSDRISILVFFVWIVLWCVVSFVCTVSTLFIYFKKRKQAKNIIQCTNSGLTMKKFARLLVFCFVVIAAVIPSCLCTVILAAESMLPDFYVKSLHDHLLWNIIIRMKHTKYSDFDRCSYIAVSIISFFLFGCGADAIHMYGHFARKVPGLNILMRKYDERRLRIKNERQALKLKNMGITDNAQNALYGEKENDLNTPTTLYREGSSSDDPFGDSNMNSPTDTHFSSDDTSYSKDIEYELQAMEDEVARYNYITDKYT